MWKVNKNAEGEQRCAKFVKFSHFKNSSFSGHDFAKLKN